MLTGVRTRLANLGLQRRIQLLTMVGLLIIFISFRQAGRRAVEAGTRQSLDQQLTVANLVASSLDYRLESATEILQKAANQPELTADRANTAHPALLREAQLQLSIVGRRLSWLSPAGIVLWTEPLDPNRPAKPLPDFLAIQPVLEKKAPYVSNLCQDSEPVEPHILLAVPVLGSTGEVDSLLVEDVAINSPI